MKPPERLRLSAVSVGIEHDRGVEEREEDDEDGEQRSDRAAGRDRAAPPSTCSHCGASPCAANDAMVAGSSSSDEPKITGMTPEVLSLSGRCEVSPWNILLPTWRFGYWISSRRWARSKKTMTAITTMARISSADSQQAPASAPVRLSSSVCDDGRGQVGDDAGEDDQRDAVADAARRDLLAQPHQEHGAADQRDRRSTCRKNQPGLSTTPWLDLEPDGDADRPGSAQNTTAR